jgi:amino acid transporter
MVDAPVPVSDSALRRTLGVRQMAVNVVNGIIGSGIWVLPAAVAAILGPAAIVAYLICAVASALIALCFAEAGSRVSLTGGTYAYAELAFGPFIGWLLGVILLLSQIAASAAVASICATSVGALAPALAHPIPRAGVLLLLYGGLAAVNVRGVRLGARVIDVMTAAKLAPLVIVILVGAFVLSPAQLAWTRIPSVHDIGAASLVLFFAFTGLEGVVTPGGEVRHPSRTWPRAIALGVLVTTAIYIAVQLVAQGILGPALATNSTAPVAAAAGRAMGTGGRLLVLIGASVSTFGYLSGDMLATPRLLFAFARDGLIPPRVGAVHPRFHTPYVAIILYAAVAFGTALSGQYFWLILMGSIGSLLIYLVSALAVLRLRTIGTRSDGPPFVIPGGPLVPILACVANVWLLSNAGRDEFRLVGIVLAVSAVLYGVRRLWRREVVPA